LHCSSLSKIGILCSARNVSARRQSNVPTI
jgi:hypothetical protein